MSKIAHLKDRYDQTEQGLTEAVNKHNVSKINLLKELGFVSTPVPDSFLNADIWEFGGEVFADSDHALEYAEEKGMI